MLELPSFAKIVELPAYPEMAGPNYRMHGYCVSDHWLNEWIGGGFLKIIDLAPGAEYRIYWQGWVTAISLTLGTRWRGPHEVLKDSVTYQTGPLLEGRLTELPFTSVIMAPRLTPARVAVFTTPSRVIKDAVAKLQRVVLTEPIVKQRLNEAALLAVSQGEGVIRRFIKGEWIEQPISVGNVFCIPRNIFYSLELVGSLLVVSIDPFPRERVSLL